MKKTLTAALACALIGLASPAFSAGAQVSTNSIVDRPRERGASGQHREQGARQRVLVRAAVGGSAAELFG